MRQRRYIPDRYYTAQESKELMEAMEQAMTAAAEAKEDLLLQMNLLTATWGLVLWEKQYGLDTDVSLTEQERRSRVMSKMRGAGTATVALLKNVAESYANGEVIVTEQTDEYRFTLEMASKVGIPSNFEDLKAAINEIKPAHLAMEFLIKYNLWKSCLPWTWVQVAAFSWLDMREKELAAKAVLERSEFSGRSGRSGLF